MAKLALKKGSTDVSVYLFAQDSSKTTGAGLTGLAYNTSGLTAYYVRPLGSATQITLATQTVTGAHSDGGFVEVDATNMPGVYRLDLPDAVCATGVPSAVVMLKGAANMAPVLLEIQLTDFDLNDASPNVTVADMATDSITAAALKADAVTEIQNGLALEATLTAIKGAGWSTETLKVIRDALTAAQADLDNPSQYKADVSGLATTIHVQEVENKVDLIDVTTVANSGKIDAVDAKVSAIDTDSVMSFVIDGFTFEQIVQIMAAVLAGKLTRSGDTLTFRDLADTVNRVIAETDTNKQRTTMTYTV